MSVVKRLSDRPQAAEKRTLPTIERAGTERASAEIVILPCVRRERHEVLPAEASSRN